MTELYNIIFDFLFHSLLIIFHFITNFMTFINFSFFSFNLNFILFCFAWGAPFWAGTRGSWDELSTYIRPFGEQSPGAERIKTLSHNNFKIPLQKHGQLEPFWLHFPLHQKVATHAKHKGNRLYFNWFSSSFRWQTSLSPEALHTLV